MKRRTNGPFSIFHADVNRLDQSIDHRSVVQMSNSGWIVVLLGMFVCTDNSGGWFALAWVVLWGEQMCCWHFNTNRGEILGAILRFLGKKIVEWSEYK